MEPICHSKTLNVFASKLKMGQLSVAESEGSVDCQVSIRP